MDMDKTCVAVIGIITIGVLLLTAIFGYNITEQTRIMATHGYCETQKQGSTATQWTKC